MRDHDVTVLSADEGEGGERREWRNGVRVRRYRSLAPNGAMHVCPQLSMAVRNIDADVVHAHNYHSLPLFFAALGVSDQRFIVTTHYHGGSASSIRDRLLLLYRPFGRWAIRRADAIVAVSDWEREKLVSNFGVGATVIPNGLDVDRFREADPLDRERPYLLTVGRLEEYKGVQHVIKAMTELPEYDLLIAGSGPFREELEHVAQEQSVADRVEFLGYVDDEKLPGLYAGAEIYVTMSEFESYGMTVAEALAAGTPCVVRQASGLKTWVETDGVSGVDDASPANLSETIHSQVEINMSSKNIPSWDAITDQLTQIYLAG